MSKQTFVIVVTLVSVAFVAGVYSGAFLLFGWPGLAIAVATLVTIRGVRR